MYMRVVGRGIITWLTVIILTAHPYNKTIIRPSVYLLLKESCSKGTGLGPTGLGTGLWDWTHRKLRSSFLKARKQEIAERHYIAVTVDNSLPNMRGVPTQLSPCRQPAVVLPCKTSSTSFRCEFVHDLTTTSRSTWRSLLANSHIPSGTNILQLLELFLCMLLPSLAGASVPAFRLPVLVGL